MRNWIGTVVGFFAVCTWAGAANAGTLTAQGNVNALTNLNQMGPLMGTAAFDEGPNNGQVPLNTYTPQGMTFQSGNFAAILPGIVSTGNAVQPIYNPIAAYFPAPQNGGVANAQCNFFAGVATFTGTVTQVGLTASRNGTQYLTIWNKMGQLIGQVTWVPANDSSFIGIDSKGVPIGMVAYGNDNVFAGANYDIGGSTNISDTWVWSGGPGCMNDAQCDDKNTCNGAEKCVANKCTPGTALDCNDNNVCTDDTCDPMMGCKNANNVAPCDDGDMCTQTSTCTEGVCKGGAAVDCNDNDVCTLDTCDGMSGCGNTPIDGCCIDDAGCAPDQMCDLGTNTCVPIPAMSTGEPGSTGGSSGEPGSTGAVGSTGDNTTGSQTTGDDTTGGPPGTTTDPTTGAGTTADSVSGSGGGSGDLTTGADTTTTGGGGSTGGATGGSTGATAGLTDGGVDDGGCNCDARGAGPSPALLLLGLLGLRRRRR